MFCQLLLHFVSKGISPLTQTLPDGPRQQTAKDRQEHQGIKAGEFTIPDLIGSQGRDGCEDRQFLAQHLRMDRNGTEQGRYPKDQADIGDVRSIGVTEGDARISL